MAKVATRERPSFRCAECGWATTKWVGRCGECQAWGTVGDASGRWSVRRRPARSRPRPGRSPRSTSSPPGPISTGVDELDRVLGGGIVPGAVVLMAGEPGVGKSTLLLDVAARFAERGRALYITGEESAAQVRLRADRIGALRDDLYLAAETDLAAVLGHVDAVKPDLLVVDSVQTVGQRRGRRLARQRQPGARGRRRPDPGRQGARHRDRAGRPRHQGRLDRRAAAARARRRRRAALRGRPQLPAADGARRQEPLRPGRRGRLLRPVRRRHRGAGRPERAVPLPAARGGAGHLRHGHRRGQASAGGRGAGAGGPLDR